MKSPHDRCPGVRDEAGYCPLAMLGNANCHAGSGPRICIETDGEAKLEAIWAKVNADLRERMKTWRR